MRHLIQGRGQPERNESRQQHQAVHQPIEPGAFLQPGDAGAAELADRDQQQQNQRHLPGAARGAADRRVGETHADQPDAGQRGDAAERVQKPIGGGRRREAENHRQNGAADQEMRRVALSQQSIHPRPSRGRQPDAAVRFS